MAKIADEGTGADMSASETLMRFLGAIAAGDRATAREALSEEAELIWVGTHLRGALQLLDWILSDASPGVYRTGLWETPRHTVNGLIVEGRVTDAARASAARVVDRIGGLLVVEISGDRICRIRHQPVGTGRPAIAPLHLTTQMRNAIDRALEAGRPVQIAHLEHDKPAISTRGSVSCLDEQTLGFWLRDRQGGFATAISHNPYVALMYSDIAVRMNLSMQGRARLAESEDLRARVFAAAPPREREHDYLRLGAAVLVDLDTITGICANDPELETDGVNMLRTD